MSILEEVSKMSAEEQMAMAVALQNAASQKVSQARSESIGKSVEVVIKGLKKIKTDLEARFDELNGTIQSKANSLSNGKDGKDGRNGKDGAPGRDGKDGATGPAGENGVDGADGADGVSVSNAFVDFDGSLTIVLSNGTEINAGEVVPLDVAEKIKVITNGGGTSQSVLDSIASLQAQITAMAGFVNYEGTWNASTNIPTLVSSVGTKGDYYVVSTTGTTNLNGITAWTQGDWAIFNGSAWEKVDNTDLVTSVAGRTGAVTLSTTDISGLGTMATQAASSVSITGGSITGITDLAVADGGTGSSTTSGARTNLGLVIGTDVLAPTGSAASLTSFPTFNQNTTGTASNVTGTVAIANGGSGQTTAQLAINAFAGAVTSGSYLRGNGTNVVMNTIQTADVPTLNQSTTGSAGSVATTNFSIVESGGKLLFKYGATTIASMTSAGVITALSNISANNTP
jgi:hypothetical protein